MNRHYDYQLEGEAEDRRRAKIHPGTSRAWRFSDAELLEIEDHAPVPPAPRWGALLILVVVVAGVCAALFL